MCYYKKNKKKIGCICSGLKISISELNLCLIPKIISFLGYIPEINVNPIKKYRIERDLTQKELARILEISPTTLAKIENEISDNVIRQKNVEIVNLK